MKSANSPFLSIITINFNGQEGLSATLQSVFAQTLQSVFAQTFTDFEYIVIDGGSTDGSVDLLNQQEAQLDYWVSEPDSGIYAAMNKGVQVAKGTYLLFLNGGDELVAPSVLQEAFDQIGSEQSDIIYFKLEKEMSYGRTRVVSFPHRLTFRYMAKDTLPHPATLIKRTLFHEDQVGLYDESHSVASDWKFLLLALFRHQASYRYIPFTFSFFRYGGLSTTMNSKVTTEVRNWRAMVLRQYFPERFPKVQRQMRLERQLKQYSGYDLAFELLKKVRMHFYRWTGL